MKIIVKHLEFNECEDDEYRCANGMCIPDEYWLDGDYDCMDWTDDKSYYFFKNIINYESIQNCIILSRMKPTLCSLRSWMYQYTVIGL